MKFPADDIWKVRLGEKTRLSLPYDGTPCPFSEAGYYVIERVVDVSEERQCGRCKGTGKTRRGQCIPCGGHGTRIIYSSRVERVEGEERVQVLSVTRLPVEAVTDEQALEEGWESADEWRDAFYADHGDAAFVWSIAFELQHQPQYLAIQQGQVDPQQYVSTPNRALDDAEAPSADEYRAWAENAESDLRRQREIKRLEARRDALEDKIAQLRRKAA